MIDLKQFILPEQDSSLEIVGTVSEIIKEFNAVQVTKSKFALILVDKKDNRLALTLSKRVGENLESGKITMAQVGNLSVVKGENADGDERLYITLPSGGTVDADDFTKAAKKAEPVKIGNFADLVGA